MENEPDSKPSGPTRLVEEQWQTFEEEGIIVIEDALTTTKCGNI